MQPMLKADEYRAANIILGLLCKAGWSTVGLENIKVPYAADLVIGFDAGTNKKIHYGTSAFGILADGTSLGWEIPEAQAGEKFSGQAVLSTVFRIITRFEITKKKLPRRILILRLSLIHI